MNEQPSHPNPMISHPTVRQLVPPIRPTSFQRFPRLGRASCQSGSDLRARRFSPPVRIHPSTFIPHPCPQTHSGTLGHTTAMKHPSKMLTLRACLKMRNWAAAGDFGVWRGGSVGASPQRAVTDEPTRPGAKSIAEGRFPIFRHALGPCPPISPVASSRPTHSFTLLHTGAPVPSPQGPPILPTQNSGLSTARSGALPHSATL